MALKIVDKEMFQKARHAEADEQFGDAASLYEQLINEDPLNEQPYHRLMIIYRKLRQPKDELRIINEGLKVFQAHYQSKAKNRAGRSAKISQLSKALMKSTGLTDKKGNPSYEPEPIASWKKRKLVVEKKLK